MACSSSISTTPSPHKLTFHTFPSKLPSSSSSSPIPKFSILTCHCHNNSNNNGSSSSSWRWDSAMQDTFSSLVKRFDSFLNSTFNQQNINTHDRNEQKQEEEEEDWDWERWQQHFAHVDEQERIVSLLKSQLGNAIDREDFEDASSFKVALAAAAANDSVGRAILHLNRAIEEERYEDAAILRDNAGAGLVGWWAGISKDKNDPYGRIIHITAEHGRYLARSFSPRQLATDLSGAPVFEVFLTVNKKGEYKQQAVYLKRGGHSNPRVVSSKTPGTLGNLNQVKSTEEENGVISSSSDTDDDDDGDSQDDDSDIAAGQSGFQDILSDMIPGLKVKVLKVTGQGKADRDTISKVIEEIVEEESEDEDFEVENVESEDESLDEVKQEKDKIEVDAANGIFGSDKPKEIAVKLVIGGLSKKPPSSVSNKDLLRVPAKLEKKGRRSFSFSIEQEVKQEDPGSEDKSLSKRAKLVSQRAIDNVMFDIAKVIGREKIPVKVLKDVGDLINLTMSQAKNQEPLSGSTTFNRIEIPRSSDPLNGLYIGAQGIYTSEVIQLRRKYGQWQEDSGAKNSSNLEFYEYVEALKITGDPYVPAGQVAFRAKVGKRYQLPHKGIIPEEFGVIARYKGQGRLAEPGFRNPRWVDGELVILDGKYIKGGPVVGFVYWAPEYQFLVFFNRLRLQ